MTPEKVGLQPWQVEEMYERLKVGDAGVSEAGGGESGYEAGGDGDSVLCGVAGALCGGWIAAAAHTIQYNGWTGANPNGYTTEHKIHSQFESMFVMAQCEGAGCRSAGCGREA